ncbi:MAG: ice-binding family protein [Chitinophagaceae bacterium]
MKTNSFSYKGVLMPLTPVFSSIFSNKWNKWFIVVLFFFMAGCKKVTEEQGLVGVCPIVISTDPANLAADIATTKTINAVFNEAMDPQTISTTTFTLTNGTTAVAGVVTYTGTTASFSPAADLLPNTTYTGTIHKGVMDPAGNAMVNDHIWTFTTLADLIAPRVISNDPLNDATGVVLNKKLSATFSEVMDPLTINPTTFVLSQGGTAVSGTVTYSGTTAVFTPSANLAPNTIYTATVTTGAKDAAGNAIEGNHVWSFTTLVSTVPPSILGNASVFGAFGGNAGITNQGLNTVINNGSIGTTAASTLITGFHDANAIYTETPLNVGNVTGSIYSAPPAPGDAVSFAFATNALLDANAAYISISPASRPGGIDPGAGELGGLTLTPGVYKSASGTFNISNGDLTLDAQGDPNAEWIFQTAAGLTVGIAGPAGSRNVALINGAQSKNVYWYVGSAATINGAGGGIMTGTIIASDGVTFSTAGNAAQTVLNGRAISLVASVTMVNTTINVPN